LSNPEAVPAASDQVKPIPPAPAKEERALADLITAFAVGDESAFEELCDRAGPRLIAFTRRMMGDAHHAEDVFQTVLVKVARNAASYQKRAPAMAWLFRIARNACLDELRRVSRRPVVELERGPPDEESNWQERIAGGEEEPSAPLEAAELGARIAEAVQQLPDEQREVFLLKEEGDLSFEEIGEILHCNKETAKSRMRYALERLRNALGREARTYGLS
jgi:RNA polymerase sigma-70 factor (ECF subfamily)